MAIDFSTPEGALHLLEAAYAHQDIEAAVAARNFEWEAREMLKKLAEDPTPQADLIQETAQVLELSFRQHIETNGFPKFSELRCSILKTKQLRPDLVEIFEECIFPDGLISREKIHVAKSGEKWGIVVLSNHKA